MTKRGKISFAKTWKVENPRKTEGGDISHVIFLCELLLQCSHSQAFMGTVCHLWPNVQSNGRVNELLWCGEVPQSSSDTSFASKLPKYQNKPSSKKLKTGRKVVYHTEIYFSLMPVL